MSEIKKVRQYVKRRRVPFNPRYDASISEILEIAQEMTPIEAVNLAFAYGRAKGYQQAMKEAGKRHE